MKEVCLGTAMWGWSVSESEVFRILDHFYLNGYRFVDTAWNYPINGTEDDLNRACLILSKWVSANSVEDLKIIYKVGSVDNHGGNSCDLTPPALNLQVEEALSWFGANLHCAMIHWDNRSYIPSIRDSVEYLHTLKNRGIQMGVSGIRHPDYYLSVLNDHIKDLYIQAKSSFIGSDLDRYKKFVQEGAKVFAYGISGSGLKISRGDYRDDSYVTLVRGQEFHETAISTDKERSLKEVIAENPQIGNLYQLGIACSELNSLLYGYIISPSRYEQMADSLKFIRNSDFSEIKLDRLLC